MSSSARTPTTTMQPGCGSGHRARWRTSKASTERASTPPTPGTCAPSASTNPTIATRRSNALLRAWSSYWSFEAFEERRLAQIDHLSGAMGLTVHARFDDELERNNGVATFTFLPGGEADDAVVEINVQAGAVDVTNPDPDDIQLPEVIRITRRAGAIAVERLAGSTLLTDGDHVLDDDAIQELFAQVAAVADRWRSRLNQSLPVAQQVSTVVLDFEFKTVERGWPRLVGGERPLPARLVLRQVRSLDPGLRDAASRS